MFAIDFSFKFSGTRDLVTNREIREEQQEAGHFEDFEVFSLAASIFKYSSTSSTRVSYFYPIVLEFLF